MSETIIGSLRRVGQALAGVLGLSRVSRSTSENERHVAIQTQGAIEDSTDVWQPYGLQARPKSGAIAVQAAIGGQQDSLVTILVHDRRYCIQLVEGEVALVDDLGQKVHLTRSGIVVEAPVVTVKSSNIRLGVGPTYRTPVCVGDTITGLTSVSGGAVSGVIGASPGAANVTVS